jgi:hypothetical protein
VALPRTRIGAVPYAVQAAQVPWTGVAGVQADTEWPGTVPFGRVTDPPDIAALQARVAKLEMQQPVYVNPVTSIKYSTSGSYCSHTAPTTGLLFDGGLMGYPAAKHLCEQACMSPTAHMCTGEELSRHLQTGGTAPPSPGWYAAGVAGDYLGGTISDCSGFTSSLATQYGMLFQAMPLPGSCGVAQPIHCCD